MLMFQRWVFFGTLGLAVTVHSQVPSEAVDASLINAEDLNFATANAFVEDADMESATKFADLLVSKKASIFGLNYSTLSVYSGMADYAFEHGRPELAQRFALKALKAAQQISSDKRGADNVYVLLKAAHLWENQFHDVKNALIVYNFAISLDPKNEDALEGKGRCLLRQAVEEQQIREQNHRIE